MNENGQPLGSEEPQTIEERAASGEHEQPDGDLGPEPVLVLEAGGAQLSLNLGGVAEKQAKKVEEATLGLSAQAVPIDGLLKSDEEYFFLVRGQVSSYQTVPVRKNGKTVSFRQHQPVRTLSVRHAGPEAIRDLFVELLDRDSSEAGKLLDELAGALAEPASA